MITLNDVSLQRGTKILLQAVSVSFYDKYRVGIIGKNGSGKTSLLQLLLGKITADAGSVFVSAKANIVTIEQEIPDTDNTALEYVIDADQILRKHQADLKNAEDKHDGHKIAELYELLLGINGFTAEARAAKILDGLGFNKETMCQAVNSLSGGWRMRLNIARALFVPSDILLLDEPTNHLDLDAVIWLEKWLLKYPGLLLLIAHDREFLDHVVTHIAHIENKQMKLYTGNYSTFEKERIMALSLQQKQYEKQQEQIAHLQSFIKRFKAKATKARQAQSRVKALERMQEILPAYSDSPFAFEFKETGLLPNILINLEQVTCGYDADNVLEKVDFQLEAESRIGLLGQNGAGKSTFIKLLARELIPRQGVITFSKKIKIGYFAQHTLDSLFVDNNALEHLQNIAGGQTELTLRKFLGGFAFTGDMVLMPVKNFSGGEKARLALALIVWQAPNVLLLDEPTNHLDLDMRQALVLALQNFTGAVVVVSHDRFLLQQAVDDYWLVANKRVQLFAGSLSDYQNWLINNKFKDESSPAVIKPKDKSQQDIASLKKEINSLEKKITARQNELKKLDTDLVSLSANPVQNMVAIKDKQIQRVKLLEAIELLEEKWLENSHNLEG